MTLPTAGYKLTRAVDDCNLRQYLRSLWKQMSYRISHCGAGYRLPIRSVQLASFELQREGFPSPLEFPLGMKLTLLPLLVVSGRQIRGQQLRYESEGMSGEFEFPYVR